MKTIYLASFKDPQGNVCVIPDEAFGFETENEVRNFLRSDESNIFKATFKLSPWSHVKAETRTDNDGDSEFRFEGVRETLQGPLNLELDVVCTEGPIFDSAEKQENVEADLIEVFERPTEGSWCEVFISPKGEVGCANLMMIGGKCFLFNIERGSITADFDLEGWIQQTKDDSTQIKFFQSSNPPKLAESVCGCGDPTCENKMPRNSKDLIDSLLSSILGKKK